VCIVLHWMSNAADNAGALFRSPQAGNDFVTKKRKLMHCLILNINRKIDDGPRTLGGYRIAHFLREHAWDVEVIEYAFHWDLESLQALARSRITDKTLWIGTSHLFSAWNNTLEEFCIWVKQQYPWMKIISGAAVNPDFNSNVVDYYIQGYGEYGILALLKYLFSNGERPRFDLLSSGARRVIPAISAYPAYPMSSLMVKYQSRDFILPGEWLGIEFSRGCKFACAHCNFPVLGVKGDYTRDADDFREQMMDAWDRWGVSGYIVADETFNDRTSKITKFADVVDTLPFTPWFTGYIRPDLLVARSQDRVELARMGFRGHYYGVESFKESASRALGKGMSSDRLKTGLLDARKYFLSTGNGLYRGEISLMLGLPGESRDDLDQTGNWLAQHWNQERVSFFVLFIPTSDLYKASRFTHEYQQYGYQKMSDQEIAAEISQGRKVRWGGAVLDDPRGHKLVVYWKNQHMNIFDASDIEEKLFQTISRGSERLGVWRYGSPLLHDLDLTQRLLVTNDQISRRITHQQSSMVNDYIHKKLSL
jgi:radical SAM superfamily enzyme YgiQ (UPF0313 family)